MANELVKVETKVSQFIESQVAQWDGMIPKTVHSTDAFKKGVFAAIVRNPKLIQAIETPEGKASLIIGLNKSAELGLLPDGRNAHLIPYGNKIDFQLDYKGIVELLMRTGLVSSIYAEKICDNDDFEYDRGQIVKHKINFKKPRGIAYAYLIEVTFKDGIKVNKVMPKEDVDNIRRRSKSPSNGPWVTDYDEMAKKTVFKNMSKWLPLSSEIRDQFEKDDDGIVDITPATTTVSPIESGALFKKTPVKKDESIDIPAQEVVNTEVAEDIPADFQEETVDQLYARVKVVIEESPVTIEDIENYLSSINVKNLSKNKAMLERILKNPSGVVTQTIKFKEKEANNG